MVKVNYCTSLVMMKMKVEKYTITLVCLFISFIANGFSFPKKNHKVSTPFCKYHCNDVYLGSSIFS